MNPAIEALKRDLITLMQEFLLSGDEATALACLAAFQKRIDAALTIVEASRAG